MRKSCCLMPYILLILSLFQTKVTNAQDWANLKEFQQANKSLGTPIKGENRVVFMGNSITIGWSAAVPEFFKNKAYINRGISGQTTPQMLLRFRQDVIDLHPKVVLILAGTNDIAGNTGPMSLEQIMDNICSMAELARANGIEPVLCSVLPAERYPWKPTKKPDEKIPLLNGMIQQYARARDLIYLDYFSAMANDDMGLDRDLAEDGVHPTRKGYQIMGPLAEAAILKALERYR